MGVKMDRVRRMLATLGFTNADTGDASSVSGSKHGAGVRRPVRSSRFERSDSFKRWSMRRPRANSRVSVKRRMVVTNCGVYFVDDNGDPPAAKSTDGGTVQSADGLAKPSGNCTIGSTSSYSDWIQVTDDEAELDKSGAAGSRSATATAASHPANSGGTNVQPSSSVQKAVPHKKAISRNFSLEGKSVPFDSPLPGNRRDLSPISAKLVRSAEKGDQSSTSSVAVASSAATACGGMSTYMGTTSTGCSSCSSGVHTMEKSKAGGVAQVRRRKLSVLALKNHVRRTSLYRSGRRKKNAAPGDTAARGVADNEDIYRVFQQMPLLFDARSTKPDSNTCGSSSSTEHTPLSFNRQNPITRWLEESERLTHDHTGGVLGEDGNRRLLASDTTPLWSEVRNHCAAYLSDADRNVESPASAKQRIAKSSKGRVVGSTTPPPSARLVTQSITKSDDQSLPGGSFPKTKQARSAASAASSGSKVVLGRSAAAGESVAPAERNRSGNVPQQLSCDWKRLSVASSTVNTAPPSPLFHAASHGAGAGLSVASRVADAPLEYTF